MMKKILLSATLLALAGVADAQSAPPNYTPDGRPITAVYCADSISGVVANCARTPQVSLGYQQLTSLSASTALTVPLGATMAIVVPETQAVRWRDDGTNPTATVGQPLAVGTSMTITGNLAVIKFIEQTASAKLNVTYYR